VEFRNSGRSPRIPETPDGLRTRLQNSGRAPEWSERLGVVGKNGNGLGVPLQNCHIRVAGMHLPKVFAQPMDITHVDIT
jgi:hypothetical protein